MQPPTTHQRMSAAEFAALPEGPPYSQLVEGELFFMGSPNRLHQDIVGNLYFAIKAHLRASPQVGRVYAAPSDVKLDDENVFEPDIYFVSQARADILTRQGATGAPDIVAEVLSPSTLRLDREKKRAIYLRTGVHELWFVLPSQRQVEVHTPSNQSGLPRILQSGDLLETPILAGWSMKVGELFD